jgi:hypothetical protein
VGIFYFLDLDVPGAQIYNITKLLKENPKHPAFGGYRQPHWWGEPWFGYYQSSDEWVIRKHMQMLANAGVDVVIFDNTNGYTYPNAYLALCKVLEKMKRQGVKAPQIAFFTGHGAWDTVDRDFYSKKLYPDLWFKWKGKPLMMVHLEDKEHLSEAIRRHFNVRESWAWANSSWFGDGHDKWTWLDNYPQTYGWHESKKVPEELSVTTGQHATSTIGRSSLSQVEPPLDDEGLTPFTKEGRCFTQQFSKALEVDPEFLFITGWNEWTAQRFRMSSTGLMAGRIEPEGGSFFVDEYNAEFSRDIEPAKGLLQDSAYYMMVSDVRRYKKIQATQPDNTFRKIDLLAGLSQWDRVQPEYRDAEGDTAHRDHLGWGAEHYVNVTGRNDLVTAKLAYDGKNVSFYVATKKPLTPSTDSNWMMLYLNVPGGTSARWLGYNFVINRRRESGRATIERCIGATYDWEECGTAEFKVVGNALMLTIPRALLGLENPGASFQFKWADNILQTGEASDFTENGDVAPDDRFNYRAHLVR